MKSAVITAICCLFINSMAQSQKLNFNLSAGPIVPVGSEISKAYSLGFGILVGPRINIGDAFFLTEIQAKMFINNPSSTTKDNLLLFGPSVNFGYVFRFKNLKIEPVVGAGYGWGKNFLTNRSADFSGGYFSKGIDLVRLNGINVDFGFTIFFKEKLGAGIQYQIFHPEASLTSDAQRLFPSFNGYTQLYGNLVSFPQQKMSLDNLLVHLSIKL